MSEEIKCSKENLCQVCQKELKEALTKCEDWEVNLKKYIEESQMYTHHVGNSRIQYSVTGGYNYTTENCPSCQAITKIIKSNGHGDKTEELKEHAHAASCQSYSAQINQSVNQIKSSNSTQNSNKNYLPWILRRINWHSGLFSN